MDRFAHLRTFTQVVSSRSFSAAARKLDVSPAAVGKQIASLEKWLGARLFDRTTRHLRLTETGQDFHERSKRILEELEEARYAACAGQREPRGQLKISAPVSFGVLRLGRALARFLAANPRVSIDMHLDDRKVNLVADGFDCAIRIGAVQETNVIARPIGSSPFVLCAAPSYLKRRGVPQSPAELRDHHCLRYTLGPLQWRFIDASGMEERIAVSGPLQANNGLLLCTAVVEGFGVTYAPHFIVAEALESGQLVRLLPRHETVSTPIHVVYPAGRHIPTKVRRFAEFMTKQLHGAS
jgi:DNA-binding transcriptional LysR family regulator